MEKKASIHICNELDIVRARHTGRELAKELGFNSIDQARIVTTISELARNIYLYAAKGDIYLYKLSDGGRTGLQILAVDRGPGMDMRQVMEFGFTTSGGLGTGLPGVKRLMDDFTASSSAEEGTSITVTKWL